MRHTRCVIGSGVQTCALPILVTHGVSHADLGHLLFNMISLFFCGRPVEQVFVERIGVSGFVLFYLSAIVIAILPTYLKHRHDAQYRSLGASGAGSAVLFAFILMEPDRKSGVVGKSG